MAKSPTAILLLNLGTPDAPTAAAIRRYLREFLSDTRVVDLPRALWLPILYGAILPLRPRAIAPRYAEIWGQEDAPIREIGRRQQQKLQQALQAAAIDVATVELAMTYGNPGIDAALDRLQQAAIERIIVLPLFPQYASSSTGAAFDALARALMRRTAVPELHFIRDYHQHPRYIEALCQSIRQHWDARGRQGRLLFSLHGIPVSHVKRGDPYQLHCQATAQRVAEQLGLRPDQWLLSYQSRPGKGNWLQPYTEEVMREWGGQGLSAVDVICPGFAADCLETVEEIAVQNKEFFQQAGGGDFAYIPALNDSDAHIALLTELCREQL